MYPNQVTDIMRQKTAEEISAAYALSKAEIEKAYEMLATAELRMREVLGSSYRVSFSALDRYHSWSADRPDESSRNVTYKMKCATWRRIIERIGIHKFMGAKDASELNDKLDGKIQYDYMGHMVDKIDEPTVENILATFTHATETATDKLDAFTTEVFKLLTPSPAWRSEKKTNSEFRIGKKVIFTGWHGSRLIGDHEINLIDRLFHVLDTGANFSEHNGPLYAGINSVKHGSGETKYFKWKLFKNGNVHLEFKRMDIVAHINLIGGQGSNELGKGNGK